MDDNRLKAIAELTEELSVLPTGYLSKKVVAGNVYYYHQWSESGKKKSRYLRPDEVASVTKLLAKRKAVQEELRTLKGLDAPSRKKGSNCLSCTLMHGEVEVVDVELNPSTGFILRIKQLHRPEHLPIGVPLHRSTVDRAALNQWWLDRSIPEARVGLWQALDNLGMETPGALLILGYGLSLSDQYWMRPAGTDLAWEDVNFFDNEFSADFGDILLGAKKKVGFPNLASPDNTSDGNLQKRWSIIEGKRCLIKGGSAPFFQQTFNEVIAAEIMKRLGVPHIPYSIAWIEDRPYSVCEDFVTRDTELIPAWRILQVEKKANDASWYRHFLRCAEALGIPDVVSSLDQMITVDFLIGNEDRHFNNFGAIRDAKTLEWKGLAPIYDSGSSLGYDQTTTEILHGARIPCKPFKWTHEAQLGLVSSFDWLDLENLKEIEQFIHDTLQLKGAERFIDDHRATAIVKSVARRIEYLAAFIKERQERDVETTEGDV
ncbi:MAG: HipA domain-containing protein, partial [Bacilli bacterium]|nr:HipA domain-containing protein [Bacilli bacterium]